jgi:hypothetical protein
MQHKTGSNATQHMQCFAESAVWLWYGGTFAFCLSKRAYLAFWSPDVESALYFAGNMGLQNVSTTSHAWQVFTCTAANVENNGIIFAHRSGPLHENENAHAHNPTYGMQSASA